MAKDDVKQNKDDNFEELIGKHPDMDPSNSAIPDDLTTTDEANAAVDEELRDAESDEQLPSAAVELKEKEKKSEEESDKDA